MTKKNALTKWFRDCDPVRDGVYEVMTKTGGMGLCRFEHGSFHHIGFFDLQSRESSFNFAVMTNRKHLRAFITEWRGLASNPKVTA